MLYTRTVGKGAPILFIPGMAGSTRYWGEAFEPLARTHKLIFIDPLGFGRSPRPHVLYTLDEHVEAIHKSVPAGRMTIVAHSFGCLLAAAYAQRYPRAVGRLILLGPLLFNGYRDGRKAIERFAPAMAYLTFRPVLGRFSCWLHNTFEIPSKWLARRIVKVSPAVAEDCLLHSWESYSRTMDVLLNHRVKDLLVGVERKTVIVHGRKDRITSLRRLRGLKGVRLIITDDTHHGYVYRNPKRTLGIIKKYAQARI